MATLHHYIPCYRKSDNVVGLYDIIADEFKTNAGTGSFTKGSNTDVHELPNEYQEVEYIESSGTQYIDTGYYPNQDTIVVCDFEQVSFIGTAYNGVYGCGSSGSLIPSAPKYDCSIRNATSYNVIYVYNNRSDNYGTINDWTTRHIVKQDKNKNYLDGVLLNQYPYGDTFTVDHTMSIFARAWYKNGTTVIDQVVYPSIIKLYDFVIAEGEITPPTPPTNVHLVYDGNDVEHLVYNGNPVSHLVYDENIVF